MNSSRNMIIISFLFLLFIIFFSFLIANFLFLREEENKNQDYEISEKNQNQINILFNTPTIVSATLHKKSNYNLLSNVTDVIKQKDNWYVRYNKNILLHVTLSEYVQNGTIITLYCRLIGTCTQRKIIITKSQNTSIIYGEYTFLNSSWNWINITLLLTEPIDSFDILLHASCSNNIYLNVDYISYIIPIYTPSWKNENGISISNYSISLNYRVNISPNINSSSISVGFNIKTSIITPNNTIWKKDHGIIVELISVSPFIMYTWNSRFISLPSNPPSFCEWNGIEYGDNGLNCSSRTQMNITADVILHAYGKLIYEDRYISVMNYSLNYVNIPIFWY